MMNRTSDFSQEPGPDKEPNQNKIVDQSVRIPVIEEQVQVNKQVVETGRVRLSKKLHEEEVTVDVPTIYQEVDVERVTVNQYIETPPPPVRYEGDVMIIPVLREVVEKRLILVEELRVTKRQTQTNAPQTITIRKEDIIIERDDNDTANPGPV